MPTRSRLFCERLTEAGALDALTTDFDRQFKDRGYVALWAGRSSMQRWWRNRSSATPKAAKFAIKKGKAVAEIWPDEPALAARKDTGSARWTLTFAKGRPAADDKPQIDIRHTQLLQRQHHNTPTGRWL